MLRKAYGAGAAVRQQRRLLLNRTTTATTSSLSSSFSFDGGCGNSVAVLSSHLRSSTTSPLVDDVQSSGRGSSSSLSSSTACSLGNQEGRHQLHLPPPQQLRAGTDHHQRRRGGYSYRGVATTTTMTKLSSPSSSIGGLFVHLGGLPNVLTTNKVRWFNSSTPSLFRTMHCNHRDWAVLTGGRGRWDRSWHGAQVVTFGLSHQQYQSSSSSRFLPLQQQQQRHFSDNLLGHSPMAQKVPLKNANVGKTTTPINPGSVGPSWGVDANAAGGGVWVNTSHKREKLTELKVELKEHQATLDDAATPEQKRDLDLADGLALVARSSDEGWSVVDVGGPLDESSTKEFVEEFDLYLLQREEHSGENLDLNKDEFELYLQGVALKLEPMLERLLPSDDGDEKEKAVPASDGGSEEEDGAPGTSSSVSPLFYMREFVENVADIDEVGGNDDGDDDKSSSSSSVDDGENLLIQQPFQDSATIFRILLTKAAVEHLSTKWDDLTSITDSDIDRAAVRGEEDVVVSEPTTVSLPQLHRVLRAFASGSCVDRVEALWDMIDKDDDGLIDEVEMNRVAYLAIRPVEEALKAYFDEALKAHPVRLSPPSADEQQKKPGWRQRRQERKTQKRLKKLFAKTVKNCFEMEVETPHRLRCIYAWAEKQHQDGKVESILVESGGDSAGGILGGKKRYVELHPKVSFDEFVEVQRFQYPQLGRVGEEVLKCFRDDLLVDQGKGRQNQELKRETLAFLAVVSALDVVINAL